MFPSGVRKEYMLMIGSKLRTILHKDVNMVETRLKEQMLRILVHLLQDLPSECNKIGNKLIGKILSMD
jgi:hypothetical protein